MDPLLPRLIVVTGRPGSGKTTLVHPLARAIRCPVVSRDEIKEGLVNTHGDDAPEIATAAYEAFSATIRLLLDRRVTFVAEAAFQHRLWAPILEGLEADIRIVVCSVTPEVAAMRHAARAVADPLRAHFHDVAPMGAVYDPPHPDAPILAVDTTEGYRPRFEEIVEFARRSGQ